MKRLRSQKMYHVVYDKNVFDAEKALGRTYGLVSKKKDLGRYYFLLKKYHGLGRREGKGSKPYELAKTSLTRKGILEEGVDLNALKIEDFLKRRLVYILSCAHSISLATARQKISAGEVWYRGKRLRSPSALIPRPLQGELKMACKTTPEINTKS